MKEHKNKITVEMDGFNFKDGFNVHGDSTKLCLRTALTSAIGKHFEKTMLSNFLEWLLFKFCLNRLSLKLEIATTAQIRFSALHTQLMRRRPFWLVPQ